MSREFQKRQNAAKVLRLWPLGGGTGQRRERGLFADHQLLVLLRDVALDLALVDQVSIEKEGGILRN